MIQIITESAADLSLSQLQQFNIHSIPMYINLNGNSYKDVDGINPENIFAEVELNGHYPTTSAPSIEDYINAFSKSGEKIFIGVSSKLSSAFGNAQVAAKELADPDLHVIDSKSFSTGMGQLVIKAAEMRDSGLTASEIYKNIGQHILKAHGIFILDTLDYIFHSGRVSMIGRMIGSLLRIHPILKINPDGSLGIFRKMRGSRKKTLDAIINELYRQKECIDTERLIITHLNCDEEAAYLKKNVEGMFNSINVEINNVGCLLAVHSGPKPIGIAYMVN